ncbi:hypothetical protein ACO2Q3_16170 [Caulobacter sp. KR2-114]|uniref:hypothetical protein n=1 Tax=Caulobacter sp. KR2-114 TaxID=3400912 RepID=UPI003BFE6D88
MQFVSPHFAANDQAVDTPLNIVVQGDEVRVLTPAGEWQTLSVRGAERTVTRLLDAIAVAQGRMPSARR